MADIKKCFGFGGSMCAMHKFYAVYHELNKKIIATKVDK